MDAEERGKGLGATAGPSSSGWIEREINQVLRN